MLPGHAGKDVHHLVNFAVEPWSGKNEVEGQKYIRNC